MFLRLLAKSLALICNPRLDRLDLRSVGSEVGGVK